MDKHPAVMFKTTPQGRRAAVLAARPGLQVIDVIGTWKTERQDAAATARYLHITAEEVEAVVRYYADYHDQAERDLKEHLDAQRTTSGSSNAQLDQPWIRGTTTGRASKTTYSINF